MANWKIIIDVQEIWKSINHDHDIYPEDYLEFRDKFVKKLRTYSEEIENKLGKEEAQIFGELVNNLEFASDDDEFNSFFGELYNWGDEGHKAWIATNF